MYLFIFTFQTCVGGAFDSGIVAVGDFVIVTRGLGAVNDQSGAKTLLSLILGQLLLLQWSSWWIDRRLQSRHIRWWNNTGTLGSRSDRLSAGRLLNSSTFDGTVLLFCLYHVTC